MPHCKVTCYFREIESKALSGELFKGAEVLSDVCCGGVGGRGGLLGNTRQSQNPGKGRLGFYILAFPPLFQYLALNGEKTLEKFLSNVSFINFLDFQTLKVSFKQLWLLAGNFSDANNNKINTKDLFN